MDRGGHAVQFLPLIKTMPNDEENRTEFVSCFSRDIFVPCIDEDNHTMHRSPVLVRTPEAVGIARQTASNKRMDGPRQDSGLSSAPEMDGRAATQRAEFSERLATAHKSGNLPGYAVRSGSLRAVQR